MGIEGKIERKGRWAKRARSTRALDRGGDPEDSLVGKKVWVRRKKVAKYLALAVAATALGKTLW